MKLAPLDKIQLELERIVQASYRAMKAINDIREALKVDSL